MARSYSKIWLDASIREAVFNLLGKNPLLSARNLCEILHISYKTHRNYIYKLKHEWRSNHENEQGSKCSNVHGWRGWCYLPVQVNSGDIRRHALDAGWVASKARNRWLLWKDKLGRLQWFETGRINLYVRKPAKLGRAYQLVCNGFSFTGLITDFKVLEQVLASVKFKGAHYVFSTGEKLPKLTIDLFAKSNGVVIKVGDSSHPNGIEVIAYYPDWAERNEKIFEEFEETMRQLLEPRNFRVPNHQDCYIA